MMGLPVITMAGFLAEIDLQEAAAGEAVEVAREVLELRRVGVAVEAFPMMKQIHICVDHVVAEAIRKAAVAIRKAAVMIG